MKLMDKIKDLFMDEVVDDEEVELEEEEKEEYKEPPKESLPKVMREIIAQEEKVEPKPQPEIFTREEKMVEMPEIKNEAPPKKFTFPIDFDEEVTKAEKKEEVPSRNSKREFNPDDLKPQVSSGNGNINVLNLERETPRKVSELYSKKPEEVKPKFKASPVISPVYGVLDKNYKKEEVREKTDDVTTLKRPSKKVDFETVRKKAFGNLADEIKDNLLCENCELYKEVKKISALSEDDLLYDMTVDAEDKDVTIEKAYDNYEEFGVAYEPKVIKKAPVVQTEEEDTKIINNLNDILKENDTTKEELKISYTRTETKADNEAPVIEKEEVLPEKEKTSPENEIPSRQEKKKETKVDADFFELIDSMYKERIDE